MIKCERCGGRRFYFIQSQYQIINRRTQTVENKGDDNTLECDECGAKIEGELRERIIMDAGKYAQD